MIYVLGLLIGACVAIVVFLWRLPSPEKPRPIQQIASKKELDTRFKRLEEKIAFLENEFKHIYQSLFDKIRLEKEGKIDSAGLLLQQEEIKALEKELGKLNRSNSRFKREKAKQKKTIAELRQKEKQLNIQILELQKNLQEINKDFAATKNKLFKQEVVSDDSEMEILRLKKENENLRNELKYEKSY
ncbi:MAG: hypothetical protein JSW17_01815 [Candidatus Omnitrophota bacterium]|nr:MAG: hypothetical protein JSW17_01815 [Candidatus Omnitrophota bacterium]